METTKAGITPGVEQQNQVAEPPTPPSAPTVFAMNYSRPTYNSTVQISYFWSLRSMYGALLKVPMS